MDCATFLKQFLVNPRESSTGVRPLKKSMIVEMIALDFNIGRGKGLPVSHDISPSSCPNPSDSRDPEAGTNGYRVIGRGVLIDYATWAEKKGIQYSTFSTHQVRLSDIQEIAKESNITFQKGDILFVRVGVTKEWDTVMTDAQKKAYSENASPEHAGVEATTDVLRWLWNSGFAAIASDAISWEVSRHIP